jgi:hypothetical protein
MVLERQDGVRNPPRRDPWEAAMLKALLVLLSLPLIWLVATIAGGIVGGFAWRSAAEENRDATASFISRSIFSAVAVQLLGIVLWWALRSAR